MLRHRPRIPSARGSVIHDAKAPPRMPATSDAIVPSDRVDAAHLAGAEPESALGDLGLEEELALHEHQPLADTVEEDERDHPQNSRLSKNVTAVWANSLNTSRAFSGRCEMLPVGRKNTW